MPSIARRFPTWVLLLGLSFIFLLLDLALDPTALSQPPLATDPTYAWTEPFTFYFVRLVLIPLLAVFGWPVGLWFWRYARNQQGIIERGMPRGLALVAWLLAALFALGLFRRLFLR